MKELSPEMAELIEFQARMTANTHVLIHVFFQLGESDPRNRVVIAQALRNADLAIRTEMDNPDNSDSDIALDVALEEIRKYTSHLGDPLLLIDKAKGEA